MAFLGVAYVFKDVPVTIPPTCGGIFGAVPKISTTRPEMHLTLIPKLEAESKRWEKTLYENSKYATKNTIKNLARKLKLDL